MKKIPTIFERDWAGDKSRVVNVINPVAQWVFDGEGVATRKIDGTCAMMRDNRMFKRRELRNGEAEPIGFEIADHDNETGKTVGWVPVGDGPEDKYHREARDRRASWPDGTYELVGPKIQGNPEEFEFHTLVPHGSPMSAAGPLAGVPREYEALRQWMQGKNIEGVVFHHPDGRMAKIKLRDFGLKRAAL